MPLLLVTLYKTIADFVSLLLLVVTVGLLVYLTTTPDVEDAYKFELNPRYIGYGPSGKPIPDNVSDSDGIRVEYPPDYPEYLKFTGDPEVDREIYESRSKKN